MIDLTRMRIVCWMLVLSFALGAPLSLPEISRASQPLPAYIALGDSVDAGVGATNFIGYVAQLYAVFASPAFLGVEAELIILAQPGATVRDIKQQQLRQAITEIQNRRSAGVVVSWGGGGNDLLEFIRSPQAKKCLPPTNKSCFNRLNALMNEVEQTVDHTIRDLRNAAGPESPILIRTQFNSLARTLCADPGLVSLAAAVLEGIPGTRLEQGLNDRLRGIAHKHNAILVALYNGVEPPPLPFDSDINNLIHLFLNGNPDCIHPTDAGHNAIFTQALAALSTQ